MGDVLHCSGGFVKINLYWIIEKEGGIPLADTPERLQSQRMGTMPEGRLLLSMALMEALTIYGLLIAFMLVGKIA